MSDQELDQLDELKASDGDESEVMDPTPVNARSVKLTKQPLKKPLMRKIMTKMKKMTKQRSLKHLQRKRLVSLWTKQ